MGRFILRLRTASAAAVFSAFILVHPSPAIADEIREAGNQIYRIHVADFPGSDVGTYTATTGPSHPAGEGLNVLYGTGVPGTSFNNLRSFTSGTDYVQDYPGWYESVFPIISLSDFGWVEPMGDAGVRSIFYLPGPPVTPDALTIVQEVRVVGRDFQDSAVEVTFAVTNDGAEPVDLGVRYLWDFQIGTGEYGGDDGPTFQAVNPGGPAFVTETEFILPWFESYRITDNDQNPDPPTFYIMGSVTGPSSLAPTAPDLLQFASWPDSSLPAFSYELNEDRVCATEDGDVSPWSGGDTAVLYYFGPDRERALRLAPGETRRVTAYLFLSRPVFEVPFAVRSGEGQVPFNPKAEGTLPTAILAAEGFDPSEISVQSLALEGVAPSRCRYEDYAAARSDGRADLVCHFDNRAVAKALETSLRRPLAKGEALTLHLTGSLSDPEGDIPVVGSAGILIVGQQSRGK